VSFHTGKPRVPLGGQQLRLDIRPSILQEYLYGHIPLNPETASRPQNAKSDFLSIPRSSTNLHVIDCPVGR
jgi:hypothetical protein